MKNIWLVAIVAVIGLGYGCKSKQIITVPETEYRQLDTMVVVAEANPIVEEEEIQSRYYQLPKYNASFHRKHDLLHTKLDLKFDWQKEQVLGKATLKLKPLFYDQSKLRLDAKGFEFHEFAESLIRCFFPLSFPGW